MNLIITHFWFLNIILQNKKQVTREGLGFKGSKAMVHTVPQHQLSSLKSLPPDFIITNKQ